MCNAILRADKNDDVKRFVKYYRQAQISNYLIINDIFVNGLRV